jgi:cbb3-type cytochrome oxidase maturation protein
MEALYVLIPLSVLLAGVFIGACLWAIAKGQYDDLDTPSRRILLDDKHMTKEKESNESHNR